MPANQRNQYQYNHRNALSQNVTLITTTDPLGNTTIQERCPRQNRSESSYNAHKQLLAQKKSYFNAEGDLELVQQDRIASGKILSSVQHVWVYDEARNSFLLAKPSAFPNSAHANMSIMRTVRK